MKSKSPQNEHLIYEQIAWYMRSNYSNVIYRFDLAADLKLTVGQAVRNKRVHPYRGYPDLFIAESSRIDGRVYHGLYLEIKKEGTRLKKKDGEWASEHIAEQAEMLERLADKGYGARFAIGFIEAQKIIDEYLKGRR